MSATAYVLLGLVVLVVLGAGMWGLVSRRRSIPCPTWLGWLVELDNPFTKTNRAAVIVQRLDVHPGMTVLDFGCGPGRLTIPLGKAVGPQGEVVAVDIAADMLDGAREKARAVNLANIRFLQAAAGEGKLGRNRFDRALLVTVLGEIPGRQAVLKEIYDALKPGGVLSVTEVIFDPHFQTRTTVARLAAAVGFKEKAFYGHRLAFALNLEKPHGGA
jgi:ubiquinone/menaquinone biosynthesis C-methylase UbiE